MAHIGLTGAGRASPIRQTAYGPSPLVKSRCSVCWQASQGVPAIQTHRAIWRMPVPGRWFLGWFQLAAVRCRVCQSARAIDHAGGPCPVPPNL